MGSVRAPRRVKLFTGLLGADRDLMRRAVQLLTKVFGAIDSTSLYFPFDHTDYYEDELGADAERLFVSFEPLMDPELIADIKHQTNAIEEKLTQDLALPENQRPVNLDPGYLSLNKIVLATTKDYSHRIYLQRGIYAEVTMRYHDGRWRPWPWTYPDFGCGQYDAYFAQLREILRGQLTKPANLSEGDSRGA